MIEYGPIPCIRHVQGVCLMYKCVQDLYHHWYMAHVYDMYRVYV